MPISFELVKKVKVYLDESLVGMIKQVDGGWAYFPRGTGGSCGETFTTLAECKHSLGD